MFSQMHSRSPSLCNSRSMSPPRFHSTQKSYRSRSRSASRSKYSRSYMTGSPIRRPSPRERLRRRSDSMEKRKAMFSTPPKCKCIGVFGLSGTTKEEKIYNIFSRYGDIERINIVYDSKTGRSRGFCFIYYKSLGDAVEAKENCDKMEIDQRRIRVDYSITSRPHTPTPGVYKGRKRSGDREKERDRGRDRGHDRDRERDRSPRRRRTKSRTRSPSPYRQRRRRNRSPSRSP